MEDRDKLVQQWFDSSRMVQRAWKGRFHREMSDEELTVGQMMLLFYLNERQPVTSKQIASDLHHSKSAVAQLLDGLERAGMIARRTDESDRRIAHISLTDSAAQRIAELEARRKAFFTEAAQGLTDDELQVMIRVQRKMARQLDDTQAAENQAEDQEGGE